MSTEARIECKKRFSAWNQYVDDCHAKWMKKFGRHVDEEEYGSSKDEE